MKKSDVQRFMTELSLHASKKRGQNFLLDETVVDRQIAYADVTEDDAVLEIGPGFGILTRKLAARAGSLTAIELDRRLAGWLREHHPTVTLIEGDALTVALPPFTKVVANLPYVISSPITFRLLDYDFDCAVVMYQEEFARRLCAAVGTPDYSRLTVHAYFKADCHILSAVPRSAFWPVPNVDSAIVKITPLKTRRFFVKDEAFFLQMVKALFDHRRKTATGALRSAGLFSPAQFERVREALDSHGYARARAETLAPEELGRLSDILCDVIQCAT